MILRLDSDCGELNVDIMFKPVGSKDFVYVSTSHLEANWRALLTDAIECDDDAIECGP